MPTAAPSTDVAFVVLAHHEPLQVRRLLAALAPHPVVLHCDAKAPSSAFEEMLPPDSSHVLLSPRHDTRLATWSLVQAEIAALSTGFFETEAGHFVVMSGNDYPLLAAAELVKRVACWGDYSWIWNVELPHRPWDVPAFRDGGLWRFNRRFFHRGDHLLWLAGKPLGSPFRRNVPAGLTPRASMQWKILSRHDVSLILRAVNERSGLVQFGRSMFTPEEGFLASLLAAPASEGGRSMDVCTASGWLVNWPNRRQQHPDWWQHQDLQGLLDLWQEQRDVEVLIEGLRLPAQPLFARKFSELREPGILAAVERMFWNS